MLFSYNNQLISLRLRLYGVDCPELKPLKKLPNRLEIIEKALLAKHYLIKKIENCKFIAHIMHKEKFGRTLATIYFFNKDEKNIECYLNIEKLKTLDNKRLDLIMIKEGLGVPYFGGNGVKP